MHRKWKGAGMAVLAAWLGGTACSSSDDGSSALCGGGSAYDAGVPEFPEVAPMDEETFRARYVEAYCDALDGCCQADQIPFGREGCEQAATDTVLGLAGVGQFNPNAAAECISGLEWFGLACPSWGSIVILGPGITCGGVYTGSTPPGETCGSRAECAVPDGGSALCMPLEYQTPAVCSTFVTDRGPGEPCTTLMENAVEHHGCIDGYECNEETGTCKVECRGGLGADCTEQYCCLRPDLRRRLPVCGAGTDGGFLHEQPRLPSVVQRRRRVHARARRRELLQPVGLHQTDTSLYSQKPIFFQRMREGLTSM